MKVSSARLGVFAFIAILASADLVIDFLFGNEIQTVRAYTLALSLASYVFSCYFWWETRVNALVPIGVLALFAFFSQAYYPATFPVVLSGIGIPVIGSLLLLSVLRHAYRSKVGYSNVFERRSTLI